MSTIISWPWECVLPVITGWVSGKIVMTKGGDPNSQLPRTWIPSWGVSLVCLTALRITSRREKVHSLGDLYLACCFPISPCLSPVFPALTLPLCFGWWEKLWGQSVSVVGRLAPALGGHCPSAWEEFLRGVWDGSLRGPEHWH